MLNKLIYLVIVSLVAGVAEAALVDCDDIQEPEYKLIIGSKEALVGSRRTMSNAIYLKSYAATQEVLSQLPPRYLAEFRPPSVKFCERRWTDQAGAYVKSTVDALLNYQVLIELHPDTGAAEASIGYAILPLRQQFLDGQVQANGFLKAYFPRDAGDLTELFDGAEELKVFAAIAYAILLNDAAATRDEPELYTAAWQMFCAAGRYLEEVDPRQAEFGMELQDWQTLKSYLDTSADVTFGRDDDGALGLLSDLGESKCPAP